MKQKGVVWHSLESMTYTDAVFGDGVKQLLRQVHRVQLLKDDEHEGSQSDYKRPKNQWRQVQLFIGLFAD